MCILWDCKSVEAAVNLQDHLDGQFDGYLRKEREAGGQPLGFLVIGPALTDHSIRLANQYKARTGWDVALVTATALKLLAERWAALAPDKPFPVRLLSRTEVIDKDRAEFLLSLARPPMIRTFWMTAPPGTRAKARRGFSSPRPVVPREELVGPDRVVLGHLRACPERRRRRRAVARSGTR